LSCVRMSASGDNSGDEDRSGDEALSGAAQELSISRVEFDYSKIPGYKSEETEFPKVKKLRALTDQMISKMPRYRFGIETVRGRITDRGTIEARILKEKRRNLFQMRALDQEQSMLKETQETDDNCLALWAEAETTRNLTEKETVKAEKKAKREQAKYARNEDAARKEAEMQWNELCRKEAVQQQWNALRSRKQLKKRRIETEDAEVEDVAEAPAS